MMKGEKIMGELSKLPNIGEKLEAQLGEVGIHTIEALKKVGSKQAWLDIRAIDSSACINRLCALEGAIQETRWHNLSSEVKVQLKEFYNSVKEI
ncbi:DNA transformation protein [Clostridium punense]|uniref:DNA transformation protein n=2 Tax=Clostridiaceae TaxID=31979 RepID=A0ABS4K321_9CLOT|nr:DNA transformation protein [Clostridium punense]